VTTVLDELPRTQRWTEVPFRAIAIKVSEPGYGHLQPLSVYLEAGVVPRSGRDDNHNQLGENIEKYQRVLPDDLVFNKLRTWQGGFGISRDEGIVSPAYIIARPIPGAIDPRFLGYLLKSAPYLAELTRLSKWMPPSQFDISWESIRDLRLRIPPIEEQRRIADYLDVKCVAIDNGITSHKEIARNIKELTKSARDLEIRGISSNAKAVGGWLGSINSKWSVIRLGQLVSFKSGAGFPDSYQGKTEGDYPFIKVGDIAGSNELGYISKANNYINSPEAKILNARVAPKGTLIFPKVGAALLGNARAILDVPAVFDNNVMGLKFKDGEIRFWYHILRAIDMARICNPGPVPSIGAESVSNIMVPFPNSTTQKAIAKRLDALDESHSRLLETNQDAIDKLSEYKTSLITTAVTGTFDVTTGRSVA